MESTKQPKSDFQELVKEIEKVTNHDIKAVEYYVKQRIGEFEEMAGLVEYVHFTCTSEDINNICHALMLKDAVNGVLLLEIETVHQNLKKMALEVNSIFKRF